MNPPQKVPLRVESIFLPGPVVPTSALTSAAASTMARRMSAPTLAPGPVGSAMARWEAAPMKKSIGIESSVFVREAKPLRWPRAAAQVSGR